jgi:signal transduction histidine kinase
MASHGRSALGEGGRPLRRRVLTSIVTVAAGAVMVFTLPLAWSVDHVYRGSAIATLQRDAIWMAAGLQPGTSPPRHRPAPGVNEAVYTPTGHRLRGSGPELSPVAAQAHDGALHQGVEGRDLAVSAPVTRRGVVTAAVRVCIPWDVISDRRSGTWLVLTVAAAVIIALSALLARHLASRVAVPLEQLTMTAHALGSGDFSIQPVRSGIREADAASRALTATARRLGHVLKRERSFSTAVSHQLRTPLTALVLGLEAAQSRDDQGLRQAVDTALRRAQYLGETIDELLGLARETHHSGEVIDAAHVLDEVVRRNKDSVTDAGRRLTVHCEPELPPLRASMAATVQVLDSLLDNALVHGRGEIRLTATDVGAGVALEVEDEGPGLPQGGDAVFETGHRSGGRRGIGLSLARSLAEAEGGRLLLRRAGPHPLFSLMLPAAETDSA